MSVAAYAFVFGFFTSFGWWAGGKITTIIDKPQLTQTIKEKNNDGRN